MKRSVSTIVIFLLLLSFTNCRKTEMIQYEEKPAIYFSGLSNKDSLVYSFAGKTIQTDTLRLDMKLLGNKLPAGGKFKVEVDNEMTTAREAVHYKKLEDFYTFPADAFDDKLPVVIYNTDPALQSRSVSLVLTLISTDDLDAGYPTRINAHLVITNQLIKPVYWDGLLVIYYGEYSKVKHENCIRIQGHDFPVTQAIAVAPPYSYAYWMSYGRVMAKYFTDNVINDENDNRILPWAAL